MLAVIDLFFVPDLTNEDWILEEGFHCCAMEFGIAVLLSAAGCEFLSSIAIVVQPVCEPLYGAHLHVFLKHQPDNICFLFIDD